MFAMKETQTLIKETFRVFMMNFLGNLSLTDIGQIIGTRKCVVNLKRNETKYNEGTAQNRILL